MNFKVGDRVKVTDPNAPFYGQYGDVVEIDGNYCTVIINAQEHRMFNVELTKASEAHDHVEQLPGSLSWPNLDTAVICDCGGLKTYRTMDEASHSHWCSSRKNVKNN